MWETGAFSGLSWEYCTDTWPSRPQELCYKLLKAPCGHLILQILKFVARLLFAPNAKVLQPQVAAGVNHCTDHFSTNELGIRLFPQSELWSKLQHNFLQMGIFRELWEKANSESSGHETFWGAPNPASSLRWLQSCQFSRLRWSWGEGREIELRYHRTCSSYQSSNCYTPLVILQSSEKVFKTIWGIFCQSFCCFYGEANWWMSLLSPVPFIHFWWSRVQGSIIPIHARRLVGNGVNRRAKAPTNKVSYYAPLLITTIPEQDLKLSGLSKLSRIWNLSIFCEISILKINNYFNLKKIKILHQK